MPGTKVHMVSWLQQYPSIVPREFLDKKSQLDFLEGSDIQCKYITNYNNPFSWGATARYMADLNPDIVIIQWSIAIQGLPIGAIVDRLKRLCDCEVIMDLHFVIQKEKSKIDRIFTKRGIRHADSYIVHALKTYRELQALFPQRKFRLIDHEPRHKETDDVKNVLKLFHPIYDLYRPDPTFDVEAFKRAHGLKENVFLFFGFIRKYKGLHNVIRSFHQLTQQRDDVSLLICGESFWNTLDATSLVTKVKEVLFGAAKKIFLGANEDEKNYRPLDLIESLGVPDVVLFNEFIPNEDVHKYFQVADVAVLYYLTATPSGIESLSYNFDLPIVATKVGHFPETIVEGENGYLAEANDINSMTQVLHRSLEDPIPRQKIVDYKENLSWETYARAILNVENNVALASG